MRYYAVKFGKLYFQKRTENGYVFVLGLEDAKLFVENEYLLASRIASEVKGSLVTLRITESTIMGV